MINLKGQESAPFELLIAVIVMGFVISVGIIAIDKLRCEKCFGETTAKLEEMKTTLEITVNQQSPQTINFYAGDCINRPEESVMIKDYADPQFCAALCHSPKPLCTVLKYDSTASGCGAFSLAKCINISPDTVFSVTACENESCKCKSMEKTELVDFRENVPSGNYLLLNKSRSNDSYPTICAYRLQD